MVILDCGRESYQLLADHCPSLSINQLMCTCLDIMFGIGHWILLVSWLLDIDCL